MNTKNLIMTPTGGMNREQWLQFRQPLNHVRKRLVEIFRSTTGLPSSVEISEERFFNPSENTVAVLQQLFTTQEWKDFIFPCIGASEIASIIGLNPYKSVIELYYEKVGIKEAYFEDNAAMFWGRTLEETIAEQWQYWEGSPESVIENCNQKKVVRKCRKINFYVQNKATPWLFVSLDRVINKHLSFEEGSLECKTISGYAADMWENGIPPMYVCQLQAQLLTFQFAYGEMAILRDGRGFNVYPFDMHPEICERLKNESFKFFQMVKAGIEQYLLYKVSGEQQYLANVDNFSPEPDGSTAYESYLKQAYTEQGYEKLGGAVEVHLAKAYKFFDSQVKQIEDKQRECSNKLKAYMQDAAVIDLGNEGKVSWKANTKGVRTFRVNVTAEEGFKPNPEIIKTEPLVPITEEGAKVVSMEVSTLPADFQ